jgi:hypothetical protein
MAKITDADTGDLIENVYRVELTLDASNKAVECALYMHNVEINVVSPHINRIMSIQSEEDGTS